MVNRSLPYDYTDAMPYISTIGRIRVIVCGTRTFDDWDLLSKKLTHLLSELKPPLVICTGAAKGADELAEKWAFRHKHTVMRFHPDWDKYGKRAGPIRNAEMVTFALERKPAFMVAFWNGESSGTKDMIERCHKTKIRSVIVEY